jgi:glucan biosynthesis protein C
MNRRFDIDALRVLAFALLIAYHIGMFYVDDWGWHVKSAYLAEWLQAPMIFLNRWRMPLLFLISGVAIGLFNPRRGPLQFAKDRLTRLLVPLVFGILVIVPIQAYCQGVSNGLVAPGFFDFLIRYYQFQPWPEGAFDGWQFGFTWNHLWYLPYVLLYTLILCAALPLLDSRAGQWLQMQLTNLRGAKLLILPALPLALYLVTLGDRYPATNALIGDWFNHATYFTVFLYGFAIARHRGFWDEALRLRKASLALGLLSFALYLPALSLMPEQAPTSLIISIRTLRSVFAWSMMLTILGWGLALLNRPFRWLPYATEAVFPWYILHQSLIVWIGYWLTPYALGPVIEPTLIVVGTVGGCYVLHEFVIRRVTWLRPLFGLKARVILSEVRR